MAKKNIPIGLDMVYFAIMTNEENETYGAPKRLPGGIQVTITPTVNSETLYADDIAYDSVSSMGDVEVELNVAEIDTADYAALMGHVLDSAGGIDAKATDIAPYVALGFRRRMANKKFRYVWLYKGRFMPSEEDAQTKADTPAYQTPTISATFIARQADERWKYTATEGDPGVTAPFLSTFFNAVYIPGADTAAPTVTVVPANNATAVVVSANIVWTFNEAIQASTVSDANFLVQKADGSGVVAGSLTLDSTGKIVTFDPTANLTAATQYMGIVTVGVKDLAGNALAAPSITKFTTA